MDAVKTPEIDALQRVSCDFRNTVSVLPVCTPYRASFITGQFPLTTGMVLNDVHLPDSVPSIGQVFKDGGYNTAYIGKWHLDGRGRDTYIPRKDRRGFEYWKVLECTHNYLNSAYYDNDDETKKYWDGYDAFAQTADAVGYIKNAKASDKPFFLVLSYGIPHFPHATALKEYMDMYPPASLKLPPNVPAEMDTPKTRAEMQGYFAHISALDKCIGQIVKAVEEAGLAEDTIIVFTSDHGETMGAHNEAPWHKQVFWAESSRVPFIIRHPKSAGGVMQTPVTTPDITKTLISLAGLEAPSSMQGKDFSKAVLNKSDDADGAALFMNVTPFSYAHASQSPFRAIKTARYTYVEQKDGKKFLFDDLADPYQMRNLAGLESHAKVLESLSQSLKAELARTHDTFEDAAFYNKKFGYDKYINETNVYPEGADKLRFAKQRAKAQN